MDIPTYTGAPNGMESLGEERPKDRYEPETIEDANNKDIIR